MTVFIISSTRSSREEKDADCLPRALVTREEVSSQRRYDRTHREEVAGPKPVFGGGDTREEVGVAAVPVALCLRGGGRKGPHWCT